MTARAPSRVCKLDKAVAFAYGWSDFDLGHGFHATKQGERYTLSEPARRTVLDRLLALNHQRYEEEEAAGLHNKGAKKGKAKKAKSTSPTAPPRRVDQATAAGAIRIVNSFYGTQQTNHTRSPIVQQTR